MTFSEAGSLSWEVGLSLASVPQRSTDAVIRFNVWTPEVLSLSLEPAFHPGSLFHGPRARKNGLHVNCLRWVLEKTASADVVIVWVLENTALANVFSF